jgi:uncharacterized lipoprotein YmbA
LKAKKEINVKKHVILSWVFVAITAAISGCGSSPNAKFYILNAVDRDISVPAVTTGNHSLAVKVGPVSIPDTLYQSQIVTRSGSNRLVVDEFNRWGGDFQNDFQRILGENISILLPTDHVILNQDVTPLPVDFQVIVNVREFYGKLGGIVTLNADWTVVRQGKEKIVMAKKSVLQENTGGVDYQAYVATQSRLLAKLSQEITDEIRRQLGK